MAHTIIDLLAGGADAATAFSAPERANLTYGALRKHVSATVERLNGLGIGRNDRVAIVLPNGPEMASAFIAIAAGATTAPLNPGYRDEEFEFYDAKTGLKAGGILTAGSAMGDIKTTTVEQDYKTFGGVQFPTKLVQRMMNIEQVMTLEAIETMDYLVKGVVGSTS